MEEKRLALQSKLTAEESHVEASDNLATDSVSDQSNKYGRLIVHNLLCECTGRCAECGYWPKISVLWEGYFFCIGGINRGMFRGNGDRH